MFKKAALIIKGQMSSWKSCQHITGNLHRVYNELSLFDEAKEFFVSTPFNSYRSFKIAEEVRAFAPELIVFIDHHPCPAEFLAGLEHSYKNVAFEQRPRLLMHLFGDFVLDCQKWKNAGPLLANWPIHFAVASKKQRSLISSFFSEAEKLISVVPFPVNAEIFHWTDGEQNRKEVRQKFQLSEKDIVLIYSGRISFQKNVELLIKMVQSIEVFFDQRLKLLIAGPWDDILLPYFGKHGTVGSYYDHFRSLFPGGVGESVKFIGDLSPIDLNKVLCASDLFVSLSTYNDEDYGMAPAEALCTGVPVLLSDWAGYSSFMDYAAQVSLAPIVFNGERPSVDLVLARKMLLSFLYGDLAIDKRGERSKRAQRELSISGVRKKMEVELIQMKFGRISSCTPLFDKLCASFKNSPRMPFTHELYREVYASYGI